MEGFGVGDLQITKADSQADLGLGFPVEIAAAAGNKAVFFCQLQGFLRGRFIVGGIKAFHGVEALFFGQGQKLLRFFETEIGKGMVDNGNGAYLADERNHFIHTGMLGFLVIALVGMQEGEKGLLHGGSVAFFCQFLGHVRSVEFSVGSSVFDGFVIDLVARLVESCNEIPVAFPKK